jgi:hypothetical protein
MTELIPESFRELLSAACFAIGAVFSLFSLSADKREHALRLAGLFLLCSVALFANNGWCYFAAVFIIATAVTQLQFLQNLAAIIRGSKEFFDYQKEFLTQKEIEESTAREVEEIEGPTEKEGEGEETRGTATIAAGRDVAITLDKAQLSMQQFYVICEEYVFRFLERKYAQSIQRHIRYRGKGMLTEFDGVMQSDDKDTIFELKISRIRAAGLALLRHSLEPMVERVKAYRLLTKRRASLVMVLVGDFSEGGKRRCEEYFAEYQSKEIDLELSLEIYSFANVGISDLKVSEPAEPMAGADAQDRAAQP